MARGLTGAGHRVSVVCVGAEDDAEESRDGLKILWRKNVFPKLGKVKGGWRINRVLSRTGLSTNWIAARAAWDLHRDNTIDLIECAEFDGNAFFLVGRGGPPVVVRFHTSRRMVDRLTRLDPSVGRRLLYYQEDRSILRAQALSSPSRALANVMGDSNRHVKDSKVAVIPNPVRIPNARAKPSQSDEIVFLGRLERRKGVEALVSAVPHILHENPGAVFRFVGQDWVRPEDGFSMRELVRSRARSSDVQRIVFETCGHVDVIDRLMGARMIVLPSTWENYPYALLEAMSCGLPVVASRVGGIPEIVSDGESGILVSPGKPDELARAVIRLLGNASLADRMGSAARARVTELCSVQRVVPQMLDFYHSVIREAA